MAAILVAFSNLHFLSRKLHPPNDSKVHLSSQPVHRYLCLHKYTRRWVIRRDLSSSLHKDIFTILICTPQNICSCTKMLTLIHCSKVYNYYKNIQLLPIVGPTNSRLEQITIPISFLKQCRDIKSSVH